MILTLSQIEELMKIISFYNLYFVAENIGTGILTKNDIDLLKSFGVDLSNFTEMPLLEQAYFFGILSESLGHNKAKNLTYQDLKKYIKTGQFIPLTSYEKEVINSVKLQSFKDISNLENKIGGDLKDIITDLDRKRRVKTEKLIRKEAIDVLEKRESLQNLISRIGSKTGDWNRDWGRISDFIMHTAFDEGRAISIENRNGQEAQVYKDVYPGACKECIRLYLTNGIGSKPIIYSLKELIENGTNIKKKVIDWRAVVGSTHPWCRCTLNEVPENYEWNEETGGFTKFKEWERKVKRKSKIKVKIGEDKEIIV